MKSKANIKGHPLHPMLILFPIAFFTGSLIFDVVSLITVHSDFSIIAYWLQITGVAFGLLAAIPGLIDYIFTVPPNSTGKSRAAKHGLINTTALLIFLGVWFYRRSEDSSYYVIIGLEILGFAGLCIAGWMGGTLVYRNQIGVDPRYANAGKWNEAHIAGNGKMEVANVDELKENQMKLLHVNNKRIVLARTENKYVAFDDHCTHRGGSLTGGAMICGTVQCPWHGSQFDVSSGAVKAGPAKENIKTYTVSESEGRVWLVL